MRQEIQKRCAEVSVGLKMCALLQLVNSSVLSGDKIGTLPAVQTFKEILSFQLGPIKAWVKNIENYFFFCL